MNRTLIRHKTKIIFIIKTLLEVTVNNSAYDTINNSIEIGLAQETIVASYHIIAVKLADDMCNEI